MREVLFTSSCILVRCISALVSYCKMLIRTDFVVFSYHFVQRDDIRIFWCAPSEVKTTCTRCNVWSLSLDSKIEAPYLNGQLSLEKLVICVVKLSNTFETTSNFVSCSLQSYELFVTKPCLTRERQSYLPLLLSKPELVVSAQFIDEVREVSFSILTSNARCWRSICRL